MSLEVNGNILTGYQIPDEVLLNIFVNLPPKCLLQITSLVCKHWHCVSNSWHLWKIIYKNLGIKISNGRQQRILSSWEDPKVKATLQWLCLYDQQKAFNHNLLKNPSGVEGLQHWDTRSNRGYLNKLVIEEPPVGSDPIPPEANLPTQHCFVSSYSRFFRSQVVDLRNDLKLRDFVLDVLRPRLWISEWVSARFDCGAISIIMVKIIGEKDSKTVVNQWNDSDHGRVAWHRVEEKIEFEDLPKNILSLTFENQSKDTQFWAGNYGAKTAGSSLVFDIATD